MSELACLQPSIRPLRQQQRLAARPLSIAAKPKPRLLLFWAFLLLLSPGVRAQPAQAYESSFQTVRAMLEQPEAQMDLANIKLTIDQIIDPSTNKAAVIQQLDNMALEIRASFPVGASNLTKFKALRDYLYQPPPLSGRRPYEYDLKNDRKPRAKLLSVYLTTQKGNCVSMPLLFVILGQKLGVPVTITTAPSHVYVKFRGDNGNWYGVETTSGGGWAEDDWQKKQFPTLTDAAIANGIYMQPLTKKEAAAVVVESLLENYQGQKTLESEEARVKLALLLLEHYPKYVVAMLHAYSGYLGMRRHLFVSKYGHPSEIPTSERARYEEIERGWFYWGTKAKTLGHRPPTPATEAAYRERIRRAQDVRSDANKDPLIKAKP